MLSRDEIERFERDGFVAVREAVAVDVASACMDVVWRELLERGVDPDDQSTWTQPVVRFSCPEGGPFVDAGTSPALWGAYDQLLGTGSWWKREGVGGSIAVRFPSEIDPGDAGWHIDGSYDVAGEYWVNVGSKGRGLLALFLFTDVGEHDAPTRILVGSHLDVPPVLATAGEKGTSFGAVAPRLPASTYERPEALATGRAGDVYVCHPFLIHAASWPHRGAIARAVAQPGVAIHTPFPLRDDGNEAPVERAILRGLRG